MNHIKINTLHFKYFDNDILKDINLVIPKGSFVSIIGPNGSGKSTLIKNIAKNLEPQKGEMWLEDLNLLTMNPRDIARRMAVVPQTFNIDFPFSALEAVLMGRTPFLKRFQAEGEKDYALAKWAMELTNTWHLKDRSVTEVSGGELQRIIVARALTQEPEIILLDEPTAHLDIQHQMELLELLQSLNKSTGLTVVAVLHDLNLASQFSDEVILMNQGRIFASGETNKVLTPENIQQVYGMEVLLVENPLTGRPNIISIARSNQKTLREKALTIHLICGGGTGSYLLDRLNQLGYRITCGVLNIGDSDWTKAKKLNLKITEEAPFADISEKNISENRALLLASDYIILTPIPFGKGNLPNLSLALEASKSNKNVIIMKNDDPLLNRDFTDGQAKKMIEEMIASGAVVLENYQEVLLYLENISQKNEDKK